MAVYFITGKLGSGKTLAAMGRIRDYLLDGRRVATNIDLNLEFMLPSWRDATDVIRIPDRPTADDLDFLGFGYDMAAPTDYDEKRFGALVLDETALSLNTRTWSADKGRQALINWVVHARKRLWDVYFLVQDIEAIDKQIRDMFCEHLVVCERFDRMSFDFSKAIPFLFIAIGGVGFVLGVKAAIFLFLSFLLFFVPFGSRVPLPKGHRAKVYYGDSIASPIVDTWVYVSSDLYAAYDTTQKYYDREHFAAKGLSSLLTPYHLKGRYENAKRPSLSKHKSKIIFLFNFSFVALGALFLYLGLSSASMPTVSTFSTSTLEAAAHVASSPNESTNDESNSFLDSLSLSSTDLSTKSVDEFGVRISGSMSFGDGTFKYFFARADVPVSDDESSQWVIRPYGPCAANVQIGDKFHEVKCDYAPAGIGGDTGGVPGGAQHLRTAGITTESTTDIDIASTPVQSGQ